MRKTTPPPEVYTTDYYLSGSEGYEEFLAGRLSLKNKIGLSLVAPNSGEKILDIGCGRGEIVCECSRMGAYTVGIDYSSAATSIATEYAGTGTIIRADARSLPFRSETFDKVIMFDVTEHLDEKDLSQCLNEVRRALKGEGTLFIHIPNSWGALFRHSPLLITAFRYFFYGQKFSPKRPTLYSRMPIFGHINEKNPISLRRVLRDSGFDARLHSRPLVGMRKWKAAIGRGLLFLTELWCTAHKR